MELYNNIDQAKEAAKNVENVAVQARKAADNTATAAKNSSATVQGTQAANDASAGETATNNGQYNAS